MKKLLLSQFLSKITPKFLSLNFFILIIILSSCSSVYYAAWEKLGKEKRDLLRDNVVSAQKQQKDTTEEFKDALTVLRESYSIKPSQLARTYDRLKNAYDDSSSKSNKLKTRINKMNQISKDLFYEWKKEANSIKNSNLKNNSLEQLEDTKVRYNKMKELLDSSYSKTEPILSKFNDYVLYLKHNLNAQSIGALQLEAGNIENEIKILIENMNQSIKEADEFVNNLK